MGTLERALEEPRIFANAHRGHGVLATGRVDTYDDPMELGFQAPVERPPLRSSSNAMRCYNWGQPGHLRTTGPLPRRSPSSMPPSGFCQRSSRFPRTNAETFRPGGFSARYHNHWVCAPYFQGSLPTPLGRFRWHRLTRSLLHLAMRSQCASRGLPRALGAKLQAGKSRSPQRPFFPLTTGAFQTEPPGRV